MKCQSDSQRTFASFSFGRDQWRCRSPRTIFSPFKDDLVEPILRRHTQPLRSQHAHCTMVATTVIGLHNAGNNCWLNALFQCLAHHSTYRIWIKHYLQGHKDLHVWCAAFDQYDREASEIRAQLQAHTDATQQQAQSVYMMGDSSGADTSAPPPLALSTLDTQLLREALSHSSYVPKIGRSVISSSSHRQEDSSEALLQLFRHISTEQFFDWYHVKRLEPTGTLYPDADPRNYSKLEDSKHCIERTHEWQISLDIPSVPPLAANDGSVAPPPLSFSSLLQTLWQYEPNQGQMEEAKYVLEIQEMITEGPQRGTPRRRQEVRGYRCIREEHYLGAHPDSVTFHLKRFVTHPLTGEGSKIHHPIYVPLTLNLPARVSGGAHQIYRLISCIRHIGTLAGGHYVAYVLHNETWWCCNDSKVTPVTMDEMTEVLQHGYIYFYQRKHLVHQNQVRSAQAVNNTARSSEFATRRDVQPAQLPLISQQTVVHEKLTHRDEYELLCNTNGYMRGYFTDTFWNTMFSRAAEHQDSVCNCWDQNSRM